MAWFSAAGYVENFKRGGSMAPLKSNFEYRVLIVDDTKTDRDLFKIILERGGYPVEVAKNGQEALDLLEKQEFDLVLCDYLMPGMDGQGFLSKVREQSSLNHLIVIIVTADETQETKVKLLRAGANDFIHKGATHDEIVARVRAHLNAKETSAAKAVLKIAGGLANEINQPLVVMTTAMELLKEKIAKSVGAKEREQLLAILKTVESQVERMASLTESIHRLGMDPTKHYRLEKMLI